MDSQSVKDKVNSADNRKVPQDSDESVGELITPAVGPESQTDPDSLAETVTDLSVAGRCNNDQSTHSLHQPFPKTKDTILFRRPDEVTWKKAEVIGRAGKATGKYKSWIM